MSETNLKEVLIKHNIKPSIQRLIILDCMMENKYKHMTAEEIYNCVQEKNNLISLATIYNTLKVFVKEKLLKTISVHNMEVRYDLILEEHGHFVCNECKKIYDFPYQEEYKSEHLKGFNIESREVLLKGVCEECLNKKKLK